VVEEAMPSPSYDALSDLLMRVLGWYLILFLASSAFGLAYPFLGLSLVAFVVFCMLKWRSRLECVLALALAALLLVVGLAWKEVVSSEDLIQRQARAQERLSRVMEQFEPNPVEFEIAIPEEDVWIKVTHYHEVGIEGGEWTRSVVQHAAELFVEWAHKEDFKLSANGRRNIDLWVVDISYTLLHDISRHEINDAKTFNRSSYGTASPAEMGIYGLYEHRAIVGTNIIYIGSDKKRTTVLRARTVAHEMAHFLGDYFKIYDNYFMSKGGEIRIEALAYEFEPYFGLNTEY
jgi:membrane protein implicated in regulation of membrane protease activity